MNLMKKDTAIERELTIFEAIRRTTERFPYIQCATQALINIKLRPIDGIDECEVYHNEELINKSYRVPRYELKQPWKVVS
ncbi:MAG: hypothetical protein AB2421_19340 [Thermotaleaceae bacterium]